MHTPTALGATRRAALDAHPLAYDAARQIVEAQGEIARLIPQRDALGRSDQRRAELTLAIVDLHGRIAELTPYLPDGRSAVAVLTAGCTSCGAPVGHSRGCRERYGEEYDH
jgi:hypothetical protein